MKYRSLNILIFGKRSNEAPNKTSPALGEVYFKQFSLVALQRRAMYPAVMPDIFLKPLPKQFIDFIFKTQIACRQAPTESCNFMLFMSFMVS